MIPIKHIAVVIGISGLLLIALMYVLADSSDTSNLRPNGTDSFNGPLTAEEQEVTKANTTNTMNPRAQITTNYGQITVELFNDQMPITTENFINLAESGFYDETKFHRVIEGFMIQAGDPNTKTDDEASYGQGGPDNNIRDEFVEGEKLTNTRGTLAMANTGQPDSGGSQFFINLGDNTGLDFNKEPLSSKHPVFGRVIDGMDIVDRIAMVETKERDIPVEPVIVESITIESSEE